LPDADGPGFVALDGRFGEANRSLIGHYRAVTVLKCRPRSGHSWIAEDALPRLVIIDTRDR
jgi:hypothetical protein